MMCQSRYISDKKKIILASDALIVEAMHVWEQGIGEISVLTSTFYFKPKPGLKT